MHGLGTIVNVAAVIAGSLLGILFGKKINSTFRDAMMKALGLAVMFVGISGALSGMLKVGADGEITTYGTMMMIISLALGTFLGELIKIEDKLERFGEWLKAKVRARNDNGFVDAFVNTSLVICVGAMAIVGSIEDGLTGDHSTLFAKALLDFLIVMIMASTMGLGSLFSFIPILILQGGVTLLSQFIAPYITVGTVISDLSFVGSVMIFAVGVNVAFGKKFRVGNMLPALVIVIAYSMCSHYFGFSL